MYARFCVFTGLPASHGSASSQRKTPHPRAACPEIQERLAPVTTFLPCVRHPQAPSQLAVQNQPQWGLFLAILSHKLREL